MANQDQEKPEISEEILLTSCRCCSRGCQLKLWLHSPRQEGHSCARGAVYGHRYRRRFLETQAESGNTSENLSQSTGEMNKKN